MEMYMPPGRRIAIMAPIMGGWFLGMSRISSPMAFSFLACSMIALIAESAASGKAQRRSDFEPDGSAFYFITGNGTGNAGPIVEGANGLPVDADYPESLVKVEIDPSSTSTNQNPNGWGMNVVGFFAPRNQPALDQGDEDFGSGAPVLLPPSAGIPGHPNLIVCAGKEGTVYVLDRDALPGYNATNDEVLDAINDGTGNLVGPHLLPGLYNQPIYFNGQIYYNPGEGPDETFQVNSNGWITPTSSTLVQDFGSIPGSPIISANNGANAIVWVVDRNENVLRAYDANTFAVEYWDSSKAIGGVDSLNGQPTKFGTPAVADGLVIVPTLAGITIYGLKQAPNGPPESPTSVSAAALGPTSVQLSWSDSTQAPNSASGYSIEDSTDGINFTVVTTVPAEVFQVSLGGLIGGQSYYFRIRGFNSYEGTSYSGYSSVVQVATSGTGSSVDYPTGFGSTTTGLTFDGSAALNSSAVQLTDGTATYEEGAVYSSEPVDVTNFNTSFTFQITPGYTDADGLALVFQNDPRGPSALGEELGFAISDYSDSGRQVTPSVAVKFFLNDSFGGVDGTTGLVIDGANPALTGGTDLTSSNLDLRSGDIIGVDASYDGATLTVVIIDFDTGATATQQYAVDIPSVVDGTTAYVGISAGTESGAPSTQDVLSWIYAPQVQVSPIPPSGLGATPLTATSVELTWTNNASNLTGYHLDRATDPNFTQNLITEDLPPTITSCVDTEEGLAPGDTYYYRLRRLQRRWRLAQFQRGRGRYPACPCYSNRCGSASHQYDNDHPELAGQRRS